MQWLMPVIPILQDFSLIQLKTGSLSLYGLRSLGSQFEGRVKQFLLDVKEEKGKTGTLTRPESPLSPRLLPEVKLEF